MAALISYEIKRKRHIKAAWKAGGPERTATAELTETIS
jgi:hypothetical protein